MFEPTLVGNGQGAGHGGKPVGVYYLKEAHSLENIIRTWVESNEKVIDIAPRRAVTRAINHYGSDAKEVWSDMVEEYY